MAEKIKPAESPAEFYQRVGAITRQLHESLRELGYDKQIECSLGKLPDAKERLSFIAKVTGNAAEKVLNTVDAAQAQQDQLAAEAARLQELLVRDPVRAVASGAVHCFLGEVKDNAAKTNAQLTDIMLAQDFHDLTGQTVGKVVEVATRLEEALVKLLIEAAPAGPQTEETGFLNGPVANPEVRTDVVANQAQVDDLLESLGF